VYTKQKAGEVTLMLHWRQNLGCPCLWIRKCCCHHKSLAYWSIFHTWRWRKL